MNFVKKLRRNSLRGGRGATSGSPIILYKSPNGASVTKLYKKKSAEEEQNLAVAKIIADKLRGDVNLRYNDPSQKTADAIINGEPWEIKTNYTATSSAIDSSIKNAKGQAKNIILHIQSDIKVKDAVIAVKRRLDRSSHFDRVFIVTKNGRIIRIVKKNNGQQEPTV